MPLSITESYGPLQGRDVAHRDLLGGTCHRWWQFAQDSTPRNVAISAWSARSARDLSSMS